MKRVIYKMLLCTLSTVWYMQAFAQQACIFNITDLDNPALKMKIEKNITALLSELNTAQVEKRVPQLTKCDIGEKAQAAIFSMWENTAFKCKEKHIVQKCLNSVDGYQVRNIALLLLPDSSEAFNEEEYQEAVINFNTSGQITNFQLALSNNLYQQVFKNNKSVQDLRCRQMILDYVEQFRTAYNTKDIEFLEQIFSEDALIITGKVIKRQQMDKGSGFVGKKAKIEYSVQSKKQYLNKLATIFRNNKRIHVVFDDIKVNAHGAKDNFYGVVLKQGYTSDSYSDVGYLFLLWDFNYEAGPKIHVRTWQPEKLDENTPLPENEIFNINHFDI
jgi:hypothetical protein